MGTRTSAGTTLKVCATIPATFNQSGYEASAMVFTTVGEVTDFGEFGREYNIVRHNPVDTRGTVKKKGTFDEGSMQLRIGLDTDDAGQVIMKAGLLSDNDYSFLITTPNGDKYYFQAQITSWRVGVGSADNIISAACKLELTTDSDTGTGIVEVLA